MGSVLAIVVVLAALVPVAMARPTAAVLPCYEPESKSKAPEWASQMPEPRETRVTKSDVQIESRDGTLISARVYRPDAFEGRPLPTILVMSPYHAFFGIYYKELEDAGVLQRAQCVAEYFLPRGYAVVAADMRGTHNSDGCFDYGGPGDQQDGYATVEWIADQKWSNGKVGMYGVSHVGMSQYAAAVASPPALKAIIPIAPVTSFYRYLYNGGVHYETNMLTPAAYEGLTAAPPPTNASAPNYFSNLVQTSCSGENVVRGMSLDGTMTKYWRQRDYPSMAGKIRAAVFHVHGTRDENVKMDHFAAMWDGLERHDVPRKALIGPWDHQEPPVDHWYLTALRWYEHWLNDNDTGMMDEPAITTIDQKDRVRTADAWPARPGQQMVLHAAKGELQEDAASGSANYQDVPGLYRGALREAQGARLIYTGTRLTASTRLYGSPIFDVVASIDKRDTNFAALLYDVAADGTAEYVSRGYLDARHRDGLTKPKDVKPGKEYGYQIVLHARDYVFEKGHRLQVLLASSDSCTWAIGGSIGRAHCSSSGVVSDTTAAKVTVKEGAGRTRLVLPVAKV
ncbi:MAG: CocE/NonD family hydrolase [Actinomycetota bacterium]|nr:CocE/NonD family hydrolase [Actinomycetota bacterium]